MNKDEALYYFKFTNNGNLIHDLLNKFDNCKWNDNFNKFVEDGNSTDDTLLLQYLLTGVYYAVNDISTPNEQLPKLIAKQIHLTYFNNFDVFFNLKSYNHTDYLNGFLIVKVLDPNTNEPVIVLIDVKNIIESVSTFKNDKPKVSEFLLDNAILKTRSVSTIAHLNFNIDAVKIYKISDDNLSKNSYTFETHDLSDSDFDIHVKDNFNSQILSHASEIQNKENADKLDPFTENGAKILIKYFKTPKSKTGSWQEISIKWEDDSKKNLILDFDTETNKEFTHVLDYISKQGNHDKLILNPDDIYFIDKSPTINKTSSCKSYDKTIRFNILVYRKQFKNFVLLEFCSDQNIFDIFYNNNTILKQFNINHLPDNKLVVELEPTRLYYYLKNFDEYKKTDKFKNIYAEKIIDKLKIMSGGSDDFTPMTNKEKAEARMAATEAATEAVTSELKEMTSIPVQYNTYFIITNNFYDPDFLNKLKLNLENGLQIPFDDKSALPRLQPLIQPHPNNTFKGWGLGFSAGMQRAEPQTQQQQKQPRKHQPQQQQFVSVIVPDGVPEGGSFNITLSDGSIMNVHKPNGAVPGTPIQVIVPTRRPTRRPTRSPPAASSSADMTSASVDTIGDILSYDWATGMIGGSANDIELKPDSKNYHFLTINGKIMYNIKYPIPFIINEDKTILLTAKNNDLNIAINKFDESGLVNTVSDEFSCLKGKYIDNTQNKVSCFFSLYFDNRGNKIKYNNNFVWRQLNSDIFLYLDTDFKWKIGECLNLDDKLYPGTGTHLIKYEQKFTNPSFDNLLNYTFENTNNEILQLYPCTNTEKNEILKVVKDLKTIERINDSDTTKNPNVPNTTDKKKDDSIKQIITKLDGLYLDDPLIDSLKKKIQDNVNEIDGGFRKLYESTLIGQSIQNRNVDGLIYIDDQKKNFKFKVRNEEDIVLSESKIKFFDKLLKLIDTSQQPTVDTLEKCCIIKLNFQENKFTFDEFFKTLNNEKEADVNFLFKPDIGDKTNLDIPQIQNQGVNNNYLYIKSSIFNSQQQQQPPQQQQQQQQQQQPPQQQQSAPLPNALVPNNCKKYTYKNLEYLKILKINNEVLGNQPKAIFLEELYEKLFRKLNVVFFVESEKEKVEPNSEIKSFKDKINIEIGKIKTGLEDSIKANLKDRIDTTRPPRQDDIDKAVQNIKDFFTKEIDNLKKIK